jgi:hypothetical protein
MVGREHQQPNDHDRLADLHPQRLPRAKERYLRQGVAPQPEDVGHAREQRHHVAGGHQPHADVRRDRLLPARPQRVQAHGPTGGDEGQPDQENCDLHEADHRAAVQVEPLGFGPDDEHDHPDHHQPDTRADLEA